MLHALQTYPYLFSGLLWLGVALAVVRMLPHSQHRTLMVRLGLIMIPNFLFSALTEQDYWSPRRLGGWAVGIEDVLCSFNIGVAACLPAMILFRRRLVFPDRDVAKMRRILAIVCLATGSYLVMLALGRSSMATLILTQVLAVALLLVLRPDLWPLSLSGGAGFLLFYCATVKLYFWIWPDFVSSWWGPPPLGLLLFGIPVGEIAWAASYGLFWPLFAGFVFGLRLVRAADVCGLPAPDLPRSYSAVQ